jgi:hypothetical protein
MVREGTQDGILDWYTVTRFNKYKDWNKDRGDQRYIIDNQVRCQCTYMERTWFEDPSNSWYLAEKKIVQDRLRELAIKEFEKDHDDKYRDHYKNYLFIKDLSTLKPEKFKRHLDSLNFVPTKYNIDTMLWFEG